MIDEVSWIDNNGHIKIGSRIDHAIATNPEAKKVIDEANKAMAEIPWKDG